MNEFMNTSALYASSRFIPSGMNSGFKKAAYPMLEESAES